MNKFARICLLLIFASMLAACSLNPRVQSNFIVTTDYEAGLGLSTYQSYNFSSRTEIENPDAAGELELYFSAAVEQQLLSMGFVKSNEPDVLINVAVNLEDKSAPPIRDTNRCPRYVDYYSQSVADSYDGAGRRPMCIYKEGSVKVELVNPQLNRIVFEGVSRVRLDEKDRGDNLALYVVADVYAMFNDASESMAMVSP